MSLKKTPLTGSTGVPATGSGSGGAYMGNDFRAAYVPGVTLTGAGQTVGLLEFDSGYYQSDITNYEGLAGLPNVPVKPVLLDGYDGGPGIGNDEVSLDIEMAISMAPGLSSVVVYEGSATDDILNRMATDNLAKQLSASWTYGIDAVSDQIFLQFAAQGQSFFNASGDGDAYVGPYYTPPPPTDDPNITSVGGTTLTTSGPGGAWVSETVWNWGVEYGADGTGGSGGVSITYSIPAWQSGVNMAANGGSTTFRNLPDVALTADNIFVTYGGGASGSFGGTSCATPLWAAFVALANQQAVANGHPTLGFINPAIYALGQSGNYNNGFHDIATGNNTWSQSPTNFYAVPGYDLCTGWGTPAGGNLINLLTPPDALQILPLNGLVSSGGVGGSLMPAAQTYTLTNSGNTAMNWTAAATAPWLNISTGGGTLTPGGATATVRVSLNAAASNLFLGTYTATLWFTNPTDGVVQSRPITLTVIKPPVITAQPAGQIVIAGTTVTLSAGVAGGLPLSCQWQINGTNLTSGGSISGAQTTLTGAGNIYGAAVSILTISNVAASDGGIYSLVASNAAGVVLSSYAVLAITPSAPVIISQPASQMALVGATVKFAVAVDGNAPFTYQWRQNGTNLSDAGAISGSGTPVLTINGVSSASIGNYTVVISNAIGTATSTGAVLTVVAEPGQQLVQNGGFESGSFSSWGETGNFVDSSVSSGFPAVHTGSYGALLGPAGSLGYLSQSLPTVAGQEYLISVWLDSPDGLTPNEFLVAWNGTAIFDQTNLGAIGWTNLQFYVTATGTNTVLQIGFQDDDSFLGLDDIQVTPLISADGPPIIVSQPANQVATVGGAVSFRVLSSGRLPLFYQWELNGTNLPNATNATLALSNLTTNQAGFCRVSISNSLGFAVSSNALLTILTGSPELITFDDLAGSGQAVPANYNNLTWNNFYYLNPATLGQQSGYTAGIVSAPNVAYNGGGAPAILSAAAPFALLSGYLTAGWNDNLEVELKGYNGTNLIYANTYTLSATVPTLIDFNYVGVTSVEFISSGGTPHPGYGGSGEQFVIDNMTVVPGPPTPSAVLYSFSGPDGGGASAALITCADGNFYGTTEYGGTYGDGTIFRMTTNGVLNQLLSFNYSNGANPEAGLVQGTDGNFYGTTTGGGVNGGGTVFKMTTNGTLTTLVSFNYSVNGEAPAAGLVQANDGNFYGTTEYGGTNGGGTVFKVTSNGTLTTLVSFNDNTNGYYPYAGLRQGTDGNLYGTTAEGGSNYDGTIFSMTTNGSLSILVTFNGANGNYPYAGLVQGNDGNFYGTTKYGGTYGDGTAFKMTTNGSLTTLVSFNNSVNGGYPEAGLVQGSDGNLYGTTTENGLGGNGTIFKMTTNGLLVTLFFFEGTNGCLPEASLVQGADGNFYGTTFNGGGGFNGSASSGNGIIFRLGAGPMAASPAIIAQPASQIVPVNGTAVFSVNAAGAAPLNYSWLRNGSPIAGAMLPSYSLTNVQLTDSGSQFSCVASNIFGSVTTSNAVLTAFKATGPLCTFNGTDGGGASAALMPGPGGNFYGTTTYGGSNYEGTIFSMTTNGTLTTLVSFNSINGAHPYSGLWPGTDGDFYGTTADGGTYGDGTIFRMTTNGVLTTLFSFNFGNGASPEAGLVQGTDGNFYGTTTRGGANGGGTVFSMTATGTLTTLISFNYSVNGEEPVAGLVQGADGNFYGTTEYGGTNGEGTVFSITTNGTLTTLVSLNYSVNGSYPQAGLVQGTDGNFYGTTAEGGANGEGTIFRMTTNGALTTLFPFNYSNGAYPEAGLVQGTDGNFYGTTAEGGTYGYGTVFELSGDGTTFNTLYSFAGTNGMAPKAALVQDSQGNFYGTTSSGANGYDGEYGSGNGTVFRVAGVILVEAPEIVTQPVGQRVMVGSNITFSVTALGSLPLSYAWNLNGVPIAGATNSSYTINNVQPANTGSQFSCLVSNLYGSMLSSNALLTVYTVSAAFVRSSAGDPFGSIDDEAAMNTALFGANWQTQYYETASPAALFSPAFKFIFMEGSEVDAGGMAGFLTTNLAAISSWVSAGGSLFINAAPAVSGNLFSIGVSNIYLGFGVTLNPDLNSQAIAAAPTHPIFNGPYLPVGATFTGNYFSQASLSGTGLTVLLTNSLGNVSLGEMASGLGHVLFGGMSVPHLHSPQPQATSLLANILAYGAAEAVATAIATNFISIANYSFENPSVALGNYETTSLPNWNTSISGSAVYGVVHPGTSGSSEPWPTSPPPGLDGNNFCQIFAYGAGGHGTIYQDTGVKYKAGITYHLTAAFGLQTNAQNFVNGSAMLLYNTSLAAIATKFINTANLSSGAFTDISLTYIGNGNEGGNGDIVVGFRMPSAAANSYFDFDNVRLVAIPNAPVIPTTPTTLFGQMNGGQLQLAWPVNHTGWRLLMQTNNLNLGVSANSNDWTTVTGSTVTNITTIPIIQTNLNEYYRLVYP